MILFANLRNTTNVGDLACTPYHYFSLPDKSLSHVLADMPDCDAVIFGGGAIEYAFGKSHRVQDKVAAKHKIVWGAGTSIWGSQNHPAAPDGFDLVGVREYGREGGDYVPCASCMLDFFDAVPAPDTEIVTFLNADSRVTLPNLPDEFPALKNTSSLDETMRFLARGETVITNSYHGAYWSLMMGRKVVCLPYSSKFYGYKFAPAMATHETWKEAIGEARSHPEYLEDSRHENLRFFKKVTDLIF